MKIFFGTEKLIHAFIFILFFSRQKNKFLKNKSETITFNEIEKILVLRIRKEKTLKRIYKKKIIYNKFICNCEMMWGFIS